MTENNDGVGLVENAEPPGRRSFRATQEQPKQNGRVNDALDVEAINVSETSNKTSSEPIDGVVNADQHPAVSSTTPVYYATKQGPTVVQEQVVIGSMGSAVIRTPESPAESEERPLKAKDIKFLLIFSVVGSICLLPAGLVAFYFACKTKKEYHKGMQTADLTKAKKLAKRTEHLIIFSFIGGLVVLAIAFAVMERYIWAHDSDYWDHRYHGVRGAIP